MSLWLIRCFACTAMLWLACSSASAQTYALQVGTATSDSSGVAQIPVVLDATNGPPVSGWSYGVCHDSAALSLTGVQSGSATATSNLGFPPEFEDVDVMPEGFFQAVVICFTFCASLPSELGQELAIGTYQAIGAAGSFSPIALCDTLGFPPVDLLVVDGGAVEFTPLIFSGGIDIVGTQPSGQFRRSDANLDTTTNVADGIFTLDVLFVGNAVHGCLDAADANDDGMVDISDVIFTFSYLFTQGPPPPPPGLTCGIDPTTADTFGCASTTGCP